MYFDTHAHYDDKAFDADRSQILKALRPDGVDTIINCGSDLASSKRALELASDYDFIFAAVGVHPEEVGDLEIEDISMLYTMAASGGKCVAIGEIGLDYHYKDNPSPEEQIEWFVEQIELAKELELPVIIHSRDAMADTYDICRDYNAAMFGGVIHSFSGSVEMARKFIDLGFHIGIGGMVTFDNAKKLLAAVPEIPLDRILIETDCPYMAPVPHRGKRNDSRNLRYIVERIASVKGLDPQTVAQATHDNAMKLFRIEEVLAEMAEEAGEGDE